MNSLRSNKIVSKTPSLSARKIGALTLPVALSMLMMYCGEKVNSILQENRTPSTTQTFPHRTLEEAEKIAEGWQHAGKKSRIKTYQVKQGDTLSQIAKENHTTVRDILAMNTRIISANTITVDDIILIPVGIHIANSSSIHQKSPHQKHHEYTTIGMNNKALTMAFEGFSSRMKKDKINKTTYFIGHGTDVGTLENQYPFATYGGEVAGYFKKKGHSIASIKAIMHGEKDITLEEAEDLFDMRYTPRYQKIKKYCGKHWTTYPSVIQSILVDMSYNLKGESGIFPNGPLYPGFPDAVTALNKRDWVGFINAITDSDYATQVGARRLGAWINKMIRELLHGNTSGLSSAARKLDKNYTSYYKKDIEGQFKKMLAQK